MVVQSYPCKAIALGFLAGISLKAAANPTPASMQNILDRINDLRKTCEQLHANINSLEAEVQQLTISNNLGSSEKEIESSEVLSEELNSMLPDHILQLDVLTLNQMDPHLEPQHWRFNGDRFLGNLNLTNQFLMSRESKNKALKDFFQHSRHFQNILTEAGIATLRQLSRYSRHDIECIEVEGFSAVQEIQSFLKKFGLSLSETSFYGSPEGSPEQVFRTYAGQFGRDRLLTQSIRRLHKMAPVLELENLLVQAGGKNIGDILIPGVRENVPEASSTGLSNLLALSVRARKLLRKNGVHTLRDLVALRSNPDSQQRSNIVPTVRREIDKRLSVLGLDGFGEIDISKL